MADHENGVPVSFGFGQTTFIYTCFECCSRQVCVLERIHPASTDGISVTGSRVSCQEPATVAGSAMDLHAGCSTSQPIWFGTDALPCQAIEVVSTGFGANPGGADSGCSFIGTAPSETSWEVISADRSWRPSKRLTHELIESTTKLQHMRSESCQPHGLTTVRWRYLTFCQLRIGGRRESSRIPNYVTWPVSLMGCQLQWWSLNKSWIQDIFSILCSLHDLYAATAMTFLMKITWLLAGIFMYGTE